MAVNNIPASVVDQIEILDDYNEIAFLKGLQDTDDKALNIKLKKDKTKFAFGDMEIGGGIKDRYLIHPTLFYYSPKTNINFIGDINNIGQKLFTYDDYINFEGGYSRLLFDTYTKFNDKINLDVANFLNGEDYNSFSNQFGALHFKQYLRKDIEFNSYIIANNGSYTQLTQNTNQYLDSEFTTVENRSKEDKLNNFLV